MQAQVTRTEESQAVLTSQQSLQSVQTLLRAGLGCITYLRNLLPSDNFSESYLTSSGSGSLSSQPSQSDGSFPSDRKQNVSGFKIMTVTRGFTEEADRLLDYLEHGVFDALQKQYLRSFIFAIYLDNEDPNNIVEAYTFNFNYINIPGTDTSVPVMSLDADLEKLSLSGRKKHPDPVSEATKKGRTPTLGEVKRSLKGLIKNLIQATTQMDILPKRRFATFKLFYYDHTPDDYEPTHFRAGDAKKDKWFFTTHDHGEVPERCSIGSLQTGHHGVDLRVASVSGYLPSVEDNNAPFVGTTNNHAHAAPTLTPAEEATLRAQQAEIQRQDAMDRRVVWDADDGLCDIDADGEEDPDFADERNSGDGILQRRRVDDSGVEFCMPIGIRDDEGQVKPLSKAEKMQNTAGQGKATQEAQYTGKLDSVPNRIAQLAATSLPGQIQRTQLLDHTQVIDSPMGAQPSPLGSSYPSSQPSPTPKSRNPQNVVQLVQSVPDSLPPSDMEPESFSSVSAADYGVESIDTQMVKDLIDKVCLTGEQDNEMLDMDTQVVSATSSPEDPIQSFSSDHEHANLSSPMVQSVDEEKEDEQGVLDCECGVATEDCDCCLCEGGCEKWYHAWCMGYHSAKDERIPAAFICFDCRVRADQNWDLIMVHDLHPRMMARFRDVAIMRRAIKIFEVHRPESLSAFTKLIGCDSVVAGQLFKRLETEGFIALETIQTDELGLMEITTRTAKKKGKAKDVPRTRQSQRRKAMKKPKYVFVTESLSGKAYKDYFNPDPEAEKRLLALSNLKPDRKSRKRVMDDVDVEMDYINSQDMQPLSVLGRSISTVEVMPALPIDQLESQTQDETQLNPLTKTQNIPEGETPLKTSKIFGEEMARPSKKVKISLGPAVDLGD
ncbi:HORMA domain-containing protein [Amylocystis lapponica]|nr:HORMA domain-containing protein [Amylocystis lapponica]